MRERYQEFLRSGPLKRVYVDIPEQAHTQLAELARTNAIPMKAQLTLLINDAVNPKRKTVSKKKASKKRGKKTSTRKKR